MSAPPADATGRPSRRAALASAWGELARRPGVLVGWARLSSLIGVALLCASWLVAAHAGAGEGHLPIGVTYTAGVEDFWYVLRRNSLVLLMHTLVLVAGWLARGGVRRVAPWTAKLALATVTVIIAASMAVQARAGGLAIAAIAAISERPLGVVVFCVLPHALLELAAMFLPLAAFLSLGRARRHDLMLAAGALCGLVAAPALIAAAAIEVWATPHLTYHPLLVG